MSEQAALPYPEPGGEEFTQGHSGTETSRDRAVSEARSGRAKHRQRQALGYAEVFRYSGITVRDLLDMTNLHHGQASSVLSVLHKEGQLARLTEVRDRCKVYVIPEYVNGRDTEPFGRTKSTAADAWDDAVQAAYDYGWLHDVALSEMLARNPYRGGQRG